MNWFEHFVIGYLFVIVTLLAIAHFNDDGKGPIF